MNYPLSNIQIELLKLFSRDIEDKDIIEIKKLIVKYLAKKLTNHTDKIIEEKKWTDQDFERMLNTHMRTHYKE